MATESDNVNSGALGTLVAVGTVAFAGIALVVTALVRAEMSEELAKKEVSADRAYRDLIAEQTAKLNAPAAYADRNRGLVSLPIEHAMELTVAGLAKDPNSATPPAPIGGAGGAGGASATDAMGGMGGMGGGLGGVAGAPTAEGGPKQGAPGPNPGQDLKEEDGKQDGAKKAPKPAPPPKAAPGAPGSPAAPAPVAPTPGPATPSPAPNGQ
jgi:hypothetical protein